MELIGPTDRFHEVVKQMAWKAPEMLRGVHMLLNRDGLYLPSLEHARLEAKRVIRHFLAQEQLLGAGGRTPDTRVIDIRGECGRVLTTVTFKEVLADRR